MAKEVEIKVSWKECLKFWVSGVLVWLAILFFYVLLILALISTYE